MNTPLLTVDRTSREKSIRKQQSWTSLLNQWTKQINIEHPTAAKCTFFSSTHGFSRINHIRDQKMGLNKFKELEITPNIFSNHNEMKFQISKRRKIGKFTSKQKLSNKLLANQRVNKEIKREMKNNCGKKMETYLNLWNEQKQL